MIRVLLVDDHAVLRSGFRTILESQDDIAVVGEAATGTQAVAAASALRPDVICMDVQMPDMDGIAATRLIVADPEVASSIVIVTTFDRDDYLFAALDAGASGFLLKNAGPEELVSAVRVVAAGDALLAPEVTRRVIERFAAQQRDAGAGTDVGAGAAHAVSATGTGLSTDAAPRTDAGRADAAPRTDSGRRIDAGARTGTAPAAGILAEPLTEREAEVLRLLAQAMSNAEIAHRLYIGEATVKTHVSKVLQKLGARDRVQAAVLAHRIGLA